MTKVVTALFDGDWILYAAGFAGQKTEYVAVHSTGHAAGPFATMKALKEFMKDTPEDTYDTYSRIILDPDSHFFHSAKHMIEAQCKKIQARFLSKGGEVRVVMLIDGDGNFRNRLATIRPYKGTRSVHAKPLKYNDIRQYLLDVWKAEVVHGQETDDEMAIRQTAGDHTIIVSIDKDMLQVPGYHLNPNKGFKHVSEAEGLLRLYRQAAMGDATDNIGGAYKCGEAAAKKALPSWLVDEEDLWDRLVVVYEDSIAKYGNHYGGLDGYGAALENMRLVYLRRKPGDTWNPPGKAWG